MLVAGSMSGFLIAQGCVDLAWVPIVKYKLCNILNIKTVHLNS